MLLNCLKHWKRTTIVDYMDVNAFEFYSMGQFNRPYPQNIPNIRK